MNIYKCKVFFEDTDSMQIVYHANYLKFCDRARTEWLQTLGVSFVDGAGSVTSSIVVASISMKFVKPARLGDVLEVRSKIIELGAAQLTFEQQVCLESTQQRLCDVVVKCVFISGDNFKPTRMPRQYRARFANEVSVQ